jgi:hypothetical protein
VVSSLLTLKPPKMTSLIDFANDLAKYFVLSSNKKKAAIHIVYEINTRKDAEFKFLNNEDKKFILNLIEEFICGNMRFNLKPGEMIIRKQKDYDEFLVMKKYILDHLLNRIAR